VPSVRNAHITAEMVDVWERSSACLLNINLYPTLLPEERKAVAEALAPVLHKSIVVLSFSRGFGMTASQLGIALVPEAHPYRKRFETQWNWFTYFYNAVAARALVELKVGELSRVDEERRRWVEAWLAARDLPVVRSGSYYVKSFRIDGEVPERLAPLHRDGLVRLCLKPPIT